MQVNQTRSIYRIGAIVGITLMVGLLGACVTPVPTKVKEGWSVPVSSLGRAKASYQLIGNITGKGCVRRDGAAWKPESYTFHKRTSGSAHQVSESIALYQAAKSSPNADLILKTSVLYDQTADRVCATVRAKAVKIKTVQ